MPGLPSFRPRLEPKRFGNQPALPFLERSGLDRNPLLVAIEAQGSLLCGYAAQ